LTELREDALSAKMPCVFSIKLGGFKWGWGCEIGSIADLSVEMALSGDVGSSNRDLLTFRNDLSTFQLRVFRNELLEVSPTDRVPALRWDLLCPEECDSYLDLRWRGSPSPKMRSL
jgi:hypothetical protein